MFALVITPKIPSLPMNICFISNPVLSFLIFDYISRISPFAKTTSKPKIYDLKGPNLINLIPPAFVAIFPPIWH